MDGLYFLKSNNCSLMLMRSRYFIQAHCFSFPNHLNHIFVFVLALLEFWWIIEVRFLLFVFLIFNAWSNFLVLVQNYLHQNIKILFTSDGKTRRTKSVKILLLWNSIELILLHISYFFYYICANPYFNMLWWSPIYFTLIGLLHASTKGPRAPLKFWIQAFQNSNLHVSCIFVQVDL
jgi:hypothetical protein